MQSSMVALYESYVEKVNQAVEGGRFALAEELSNEYVDEAFELFLAASA